MNHAAINALVAEQVMGWKVRRESGHHWEVPLESPYFREWDQATWPHTPDFAGNIAHAMEMAMKVTRAESIMELTLKSGKWTCTIVRRVGFTYPKSVVADTPALAICLAVLRAVGVPDKEIEEVANG